MSKDKDSNKPSISVNYKRTNQGENFKQSRSTEDIPISINNKRNDDNKPAEEVIQTRTKNQSKRKTSTRSSTPGKRNARWLLIAMLVISLLAVIVILVIRNRSNNPPSPNIDPAQSAWIQEKTDRVNCVKTSLSNFRDTKNVNNYLDDYESILIGLKNEISQNKTFITNEEIKLVLLLCEKNYLEALTCFPNDMIANCK